MRSHSRGTADTQVHGLNYYSMCDSRCDLGITCSTCTNADPRVSLYTSRITNFQVWFSGICIFPTIFTVFFTHRVENPSSKNGPLMYSITFSIQLSQSALTCAEPYARHQNGKNELTSLERKTNMQTDNFSTPVIHPVEFGNTWKMNYRCKDPQRIHPEIQQTLS